MSRGTSARYGMEFLRTGWRGSALTVEANFLERDYLDKNARDFLMNEKAVSEASLAALNEVIADFSEAIMQCSFVRPHSLVGIPTKAFFHARVTTLPPERITFLLRHYFIVGFRSILATLDDDFQSKFSPADKGRLTRLASKEEVLEGHSYFLITTERTFLNVLEFVQFFEPRIALILDEALGKGAADLFNEFLSELAIGLFNEGSIQTHAPNYSFARDGSADLYSTMGLYPLVLAFENQFSRRRLKRFLLALSKLET